MPVLKIVNGITDHLAVRLAEWACTVILFMFGLTLLGEGRSFDNPSFAVMARFASEDRWGTLIVSVAGVRLAALIINGTFRWSMRVSLVVRAISATLCIGIWFSLALGIYLAGSDAPGSRTYGVLMLVDIFTAVYTAGKSGRSMRPQNGCA